MASEKVVDARVEDIDLDLETVTELGGNKEDLKLLQDVEDIDEDYEIKEDFDAEPVKRDDVAKFISELEIYKYRDHDSIPAKKKKKHSDVPDEGRETSVLETPPSTETKVKKQKNKFKTKEAIQHDEVSSTTSPTTAITSTKDIKEHIKNFKPRKYIIANPAGRWFDEEASNKEPTVFQEPEEVLLMQMEEFASKLLEDEVSIFHKKKEKAKRSEVQWLKTVLASGTLSDKMAALTLLLKDNPVHNLSSLDTLINMTKKKGKREAMMAADTLRELFLTDLLPDDRKLKKFEQHPFACLVKVYAGNRDSIDKRLILWLYESKLKEKYETFVQALDVMSHDTVPATKQKALGIVHSLLTAKPEQEKKFLNMLVNKVGDPDYKVASKSSYLLTKLVEQHPNMKLVIVNEMERLLYRPNVAQKAQYYGICFLNQLVIYTEEKELAVQLIKCYFSFFRTFVKNGEVESKMMSALLSGVNRAYPYAKEDSKFIDEQMGTLYKITHIVNFNTSIQALMLLYQVMDSNQSISDRFYMLLYRKMADPAFKTSTKQTVFMNILYKSMKKDMSDRRIKAFIKRLLQICSYFPVHVICASLILLSEVLRARPGLLNMSHSCQLDSDDEEHFVDVEIESDEESKSPGNGNDSSSDESESSVHEQFKKPSWIHRKNLGDKADSSQYNPHHRNPLYCNADQECVWELKKLTKHFHPTVALYAKTLLAGNLLTYNGDPLQDFTLIRFLDRFVFKNPKKKELEQPKSAVARKIKNYAAKSIKTVPVNSPQYLQMDENKIPEDEKFFHRYFTQKAAQSKKIDEDSDESDESVSDDEFDDYLDGNEGNVDFDDLNDLNFDFASEMGRTKRKKTKDVDVDDEDDSDDLENLSDEEPDFDDFGDEFKEFDEKSAEEKFSDEDDDLSDEEETSDKDDNLMELDPLKPKRKTKLDWEETAFGPSSSSKKKKKPNQNNSAGLFAAADEFAELIDDNIGAKFSMIGSDAVSNKDNADAKQLKWEAKRDQWLKGSDWKTRKRQQGKQGRTNKGKGKSFRGQKK